MNLNQTVLDNWLNRLRKTSLRCRFCGGYTGGVNGKSCKYCGKRYCLEHLLPEKHCCTSLGEAKHPSVCISYYRSNNGFTYSAF